jgi:acyl dehydratase
LVTPLAWRSCDHTGPVFEGDVLTTELVVEAVHPLEGGHGLADLRARVRAARAPRWEEEQDVLDWRFVGLMA